MSKPMAVRNHNKIYQHVVFNILLNRGRQSAANTELEPQIITQPTTVTEDCIETAGGSYSGYILQIAPLSP